MSEQTANPVATAMAMMPDIAEKDQRNDYMKYDYASADSLYTTVKQSLANAGLTLWRDELERTVDRVEVNQVVKGKPVTVTKVWITITYVFAILKDGTDMPVDGVRYEKFTVMDEYKGVQTCGALAAYATKYYLRNKFLIATGEVDTELDAEPETQMPQSAKQNGQAKQGEQPELPQPRWAYNKTSGKYELHGTVGVADSAKLLFERLRVDFTKRDRTDEEMEIGARVAQNNLEKIESVLSAVQMENIMDLWKKTGIYNMMGQGEQVEDSDTTHEGAKETA